MSETIENIPCEIIDQWQTKFYIVTLPPKESGYTLEGCIKIAKGKYPLSKEITISFPSYYSGKPDSWKEGVTRQERKFTQDVVALSKAVNKFVEAVDGFVGEE